MDFAAMPRPGLDSVLDIWRITLPLYLLGWIILNQNETTVVPTAVGGDHSVSLAADSEQSKYDCAAGT